MKRFVLPFLLAAALPAGDSRIVPGMNAFTAASYQQLTRGDANLALSPFNIATALSMVLGGARGPTAAEIATVLHQHYDPSYDSALAALAADLAKAGNAGGNELLTANGLWVQKGFPIQPEFQKTLANEYHAPLAPLDFFANAEAARGEINGWTEQHTKDRIKNLFPAGSLSTQTQLVLTSAIYFYGKWQSPFLTSRTQPAGFTLPSGAATQTNFMNQTAHFNYAETPSSQILEMPYAGTGIAFDVLLPRVLPDKPPDNKTSRIYPGVTGLGDIERSLTSDKLTVWLSSLTSRNVQVALPKFRVEAEFSLGKALAAMGMPAAFTDHADFSGISSSSDGRGKLAISEVMHKAFVDVSEQGTEAAAATGTAMRAISMRMPEPPVVFRADHPFLFLIRDTRSGVILFIGRLTNPKS
jgi:serpin B